MDKYELEKIGSILTSTHSKITNIKISNLTSAGDNYVSVILCLEISLSDETKIKAVAKMLPKNPFLQKLFNSEVTFRNEVGYYREIAPCLRRFQKEQGVKSLLSSYPDFYGSRFNLDGGDRLDQNAVLLLQNLNEENYKILDRRHGLDLPQSRLVLEKIAEVHASVIALRTNQPHVFGSKIAPFLKRYTLYDNDGGWNELIETILVLVENCGFGGDLLPKIRRLLDYNLTNIVRKNNEIYNKFKFLTLIHCDLWTNNIMIKFDGSEPVDAKFVDYQVFEYCSGAKDVIFFLLDSVQLTVLDKHMDDLLLFYFERFSDWLKNLKCPLLFGFDEFLSEVGLSLREVGFLQVMLMMNPIYMQEEGTKDIEELNSDDFVDFKTKLDKRYKPRVNFILRELIHREWIL